MTQNYKVLIVDDIFTNRLLLREIIKKFTDHYFEAKNGKEAIDMLKEKDFDIVLMDIEMPVMNGLETTKYIRTQLPYPKNKIPIIALTAHNPYSFFEEYEDVGFSELMTKPYSVEKLTTKIKSIQNK